jgi:hypothetical protein
MGIFRKEKTIKEYSCGERKFHLSVLTRKQVANLERSGQRMREYAESGNWPAHLKEVAYTLALALTPEGARPEWKDVDAIREQILDLPFRFVIETLADISASVDANEKLLAEKNR